jgi:hypothetical protein
MAENLIRKLLPHQGCVIKRTGEGIEIAGSAMNLGDVCRHSAIRLQAAIPVPRRRQN